MHHCTGLHHCGPSQHDHEHGGQWDCGRTSLARWYRTAAAASRPATGNHQQCTGKTKMIGCTGFWLENIHIPCLFGMSFIWLANWIDFCMGSRLPSIHTQSQAWTQFKLEWRTVRFDWILVGCLVFWLKVSFGCCLSTKATYPCSISSSVPATGFLVNLVPLSVETVQCLRSRESLLSNVFFLQKFKFPNILEPRLSHCPLVIVENTST